MLRGGTVKVLPKLCYLGNNNGYKYRYYMDVLLHQ